MRYLLSLLLASMLSACGALVQTTPQWDSQFGVDTRMALAQQIRYPQAQRNTDPVSGMDNRSARAAYERYQKIGAGPQQPSMIDGGAK